MHRSAVIVSLLLIFGCTQGNDHANGPGGGGGSTGGGNGGPPGPAQLETVLELPLPANLGTPNGVMAGLINTDGLIDIVVLGDELAYFQNGTGLAFQEVPGTFPAGIEARPGSIADLNGDTLPDLVVGLVNPIFLPVGTQQSMLLYQQPNGTFTDASTNLPTSAYWSSHIIAAELSGDTAIDIFNPHTLSQIGPVDPQDRIYINNGSGVFSDETDSVYNVSTANPSLRGVAADFDGDGDNDILTGGGFNNDYNPFLQGTDMEIHFQDAFGIFQFGNIPAADVHCKVLLAADVDFDGDMDFLVGDRSDPSPGVVQQDNSIYINNGSGTFTGPVALGGTAGSGTGLSVTEVMEFGDFRGNGYPDLVVAGSDLFENDGSGTFTPATASLTWTIPSNYGDFTAVAARDFDNDGDIDLIGTALNSNDNQYYLLVLRNNRLP